MTESEIKRFISKRDKWYYYYDFGVCKVSCKNRKTIDNGMNNWKKISPIIRGVMSEFDKPYFLDIGCNMGLYAYEISKLGGITTGVDIKVSQANFFQRFIRENKNDEFNAEFFKYDVTKNKPKDLITECDIVSFFCVIYHLAPNHDFVLENLPSHKYIVMQGNTPRLSSKKRRREGQHLAGVDGMINLLQTHGYKTEVYLKKYTKPVVIGKR